MTGIIPVQDLSTRDVLYGARSTTFRYELLQHNTTTGADELIGYLAGVDGGSLSWSAQARVKKSIRNFRVKDLASAGDGLTRIGAFLDDSQAVNLATVRIRPVLEVAGLPDIYLGTYLLSSSPEVWADTGRTFELELLDKTSVLDQDAFEETFTAGTSDPVLEIVRDVIVSAGEAFQVDGSDVRTLNGPMSWEPGTSKLTIVNELLEVLLYRALWMDGRGRFRASPYVRPADRPILYSMLSDAAGPLVRELRDGPESIYSPDWLRERDTYRVPNKVIALQQASGDEEPLSGVATNEDPGSPFSYQRRGDRWVLPVGGPVVVETPDFSGEADPEAATVAFLDEKARQSLIAMSSVQAGVSVRCLPVPVELLDAVVFASAPAGIDARHTVQRVELPLQFDGLMSLELLEVVDL